jgi:hypothetical protein
MLSMKRLFKRESTAKTLIAILKEEVPPVGGKHGVSRAWDAFLARALAKDAGKRFTSARSMSDALKVVLLESDDALPNADDLAHFLGTSRALEAEPDLALVDTVLDVAPSDEPTMPVHDHDADALPALGAVERRRDISAA